MLLQGGRPGGRRGVEKPRGALACWGAGDSAAVTGAARGDILGEMSRRQWEMQDTSVL